LTANREVPRHEGVRAIARRHGKTTSQVVFRFCQQVGMLPLTGTSGIAHMKEDLAIDDFTLDAGEIAMVERAGTAT